MIDSIIEAFNSVLFVISSYVPKLLAGLLIILIGLIVASLLKDLLTIVFTYFKLEKVLEKSGIAKKKDLVVWPGLFAELGRWVVIFIFLLSAVDVWGIPKVGEVLSQLLIFLPNVLVAVVIGWIGLVAAKFASNIVIHGIQGMEKRELYILSSVAKYSILFFTTLIILTQLGIAADLVKILFTGIIGMLALAGGLAFGLGGKDEAREILRKIRARLETLPETKEK